MLGQSIQVYLTIPRMLVSCVVLLAELEHNSHGSSMFPACFQVCSRSLSWSQRRSKLDPNVLWSFDWDSGPFRIRYM